MSDETKTAQENTDAAEEKTQEAQAQTPSQQDGGMTDGQREAGAEPGGEGQGQAEEFSFTPPEGIDLDPAAVEGFRAIAKKHQLKGEAAQEVAEYGVKLFAQQKEAIDAQVTKWAEEAKADPDLTKGFDKNLALAESALKKYGDDTLVTLLRSSGLGNHPAIIKFCWKIGKAIAEPKPAEEKDIGNTPLMAETSNFAGALFEKSLKGE